MTVQPSPDNAPVRGNAPGQGDTKAEAARLRELFEPTVQSHRLFLEDVSVNIAGSHRTVHVVVDLPENESGGVGLDVIAEISKELSADLDRDPNQDSRPYNLEVSSPGVSRPLTEPRHWHRARGRMVKVNVLQGENVTGRLIDVDDDAVTVRPEVAVKKGMKPKQGDPVRIPYGKIRRGNVEVEFTHMDEVIPHEEMVAAASTSEKEEEA